MLPRHVTWMTHVRNTARLTSTPAPAGCLPLRSATSANATRPYVSSLTRWLSIDIFYSSICMFFWWGFFLVGLILLFKPGVKCQRKSCLKYDFTDFESNHSITSVTYMPLKATVHIYSICSHFKARSVTLLIKCRWKLCWKLKIFFQVSKGRVLQISRYCR